MKNIVLVGNYGVGNTGDELLMLGALSRIKSEFGEVLVSIVSGGQNVQDGYEILTRFPAGFRSLLNFSWIRTWFKLVKADAVVFGGGVLFDCRDPFSFLVWFQYVFWTRLFSQERIFWGLSVSKPLKKWHERILKRIFEKVAFLSVRDRSSVEVLNNLGIQDVLLENDLASYLSKEFLGVRNTSSDEFHLIVSVRGGTLWDDLEFQDSFASKLNTWTSGLGKKMRINLIPFQIGAGDQDDMRICRNLEEKIPGSIVSSNDVGTVLSEYRKADLVIGSRLHSVILAHLIGVPFVALSYHEKVRAYVESHIPDGKVFDLNEGGLSSLFNQISL